ncbi:MAG: ferrochelatase [Chloroflexota bacterium]|nr:ferrochelatase [Chloroflexota bacterium]
MTYGSPASLDDVERYITAVRGGREVSRELVDEMRRRYESIGGSPLIQITLAQARTLERRLAGGALVRAGMRFSGPSIADALSELAAAGVRDVLGIVMSPQFSPLLMGGYGRALEEARRGLGPGAPGVLVAGAWHTQPAFLDALAGRIVESISKLPARDAESLHVLLTAHSLPRRVADQEPDYLAQLAQTAREVAGRAGLDDESWSFCWQSAGHEPAEWLKPDFADLMPQLAGRGVRAVVVAPVQFLADHLEVLYDIDVAARAQAEAHGLRFVRTRSLNDDEQLIDALADMALTYAGGRRSRAGAA